MSDDAPSDPPHWCYHCNKRVLVETLHGEFVVCSECNKGFVESIQQPMVPRSPPLSPDLRVEDSSIGSHFLQMLRLLTHAPSPPRLDVLSYEDEFFGLEINRTNEFEDDEDDEEEEEEEEEEDREEMFPITTTRSITGRNRILDWAEILMGIEDNSGNLSDYVDDGAGYEALLQNLAEGDGVGGGGGRRGAPPAAKSAIEALETFEVCSDDKMMVVVVCAVCKDGMVIGETVKKLPCGHCYHGNCILPWLGTRNSCPVCRFQLKTDDAEYEEERKKRTTTINTTALTDSSSATASSST